MSKVLTRRPAVAGTFYAARELDLRAQIVAAFTHPLGPADVPKVNPSRMRSIVGMVCPHAGYLFSGPVSACAFSALAQDGTPDVAVLIGPNHRGSGPEIAVDSSQFWETPLGACPVDTQLAKDIVSNSHYARFDSAAHVHEHSLEVQVPFLQYLYGNGIRIVPILMTSQNLETSGDLGHAIASAGRGHNLVIIASTDLSHYQSHDKASQSDRHVLESIIRVAPADLIKTVAKEHLTVCGPAPVSAMLAAAQMLGAVRANVLCYATSGDTSGDYSRVVGYAAAVVARGDRQ